MKKITGIFIVLSLVTFSAMAEDVPVVAVSKTYVDSGLALKASASTLDIIVNSLATNDTITKANTALQPASKGVAGGLATLGVDGKVPTEQLPAGATQVNSDWNATTGTAQILNKPAVGVTTGTIAAGDDFRFMAVPTAAPSGNAPSGWVYMWFE